MPNSINVFLMSILLVVGLSACQKQAETQSTNTDATPATTAPQPAPTNTSTKPAEQSTSSAPAQSSKTTPKVIVVPEKQKSNTAAEAAAVHRGVAAPLRRAIGAEKYIQNHP